MPLQPLLSAEKAAANMAEIHPPMRPQEALVEAERCLYCFDAPCIAACPTGIDVPAFIKKIASGNDAGAARTILTANILGASCARVCPTKVLCEGACVLHDRDEKPIEIGRLQRHATDFVRDHHLKVLQPPAKRNGTKVAVIGAGPAGLGCAAELAQLGYSVTILEKEKLPGGLNTYGIAYYKMTPAFSLEEIELVKSLGVEIRCGVAVGRDVSGADLQQEYKAIFVGIGLGEGHRLGVPGEDLPEVLDALAYIKRVHAEPLDRVPVGRRVVVIGCGNTAIDAVSQSLRLGAEHACIIYRRGASDMTAYDFEYELAKKEGAEFHFHAAPVEVLHREGHVSGLKLVRTRVTGAGTLEPIAGSEWIEPCDMILKAVGQEKQVPLLKKLFPSLKLNDRGAVAIDPLTGATNLAHVFAGGDCANGGREVVNAVGEGKKAAHGIHKFLSGKSQPYPEQPSRLGAQSGASGSGLLHPIRAHELEAELARKNHAPRKPGAPQ
ncbi:MAG: NAD(P)-dependent oxidoreductase [Planctomycetes bacterium]|nr:NAD(P)-dependent oxidoreductase [Planctomycetota bacterium]